MTTQPTTSVGNIIPSLIRTGVPLLVGLLVTWLLSINITVSAADQAAIGGATATAVAALYYAGVRLLEQKYPWTSKLLGSSKSPSYAGLSTDVVGNGWLSPSDVQAIKDAEAAFVAAGNDAVQSKASDAVADFTATLAGLANIGYGRHANKPGAAPEASLQSNEARVDVSKALPAPTVVVPVVESEHDIDAPDFDEAKLAQPAAPTGLAVTE